MPILSVPDEESENPVITDLDIKALCAKLRSTKPPYECPVESCRKLYKSYCGLEYHLYHFDHKEQISAETVGGGKEDNASQMISDGLMKLQVNGKMLKLDVLQALEVVYEEPNISVTEKSLYDSHSAVANKSVAKMSKSGVANNELKLPEACFHVIENALYIKSGKSRSKVFYRHVEKTLDEHDEIVEYDMDEEDFAWLDLVNDQYDKRQLPAVTPELFESTMDRFEKEAHFCNQSTGQENAMPADVDEEDAICSICLDGECENSNAILFCDMCNLAVHQDCYGVPYIPEGQWLCRRCLESPSRAVDCCLCPTRGGAFKQTNSGQWAHVVCALWIPEVGFANTVFLEPIDGIDRIPAARWKLTCYICKQRSKGACIQCHKTNCYTAFHVTCAQLAGLYMRIEQLASATAGSLVHKTAFCDLHTPENSFGPMMKRSVSEDVSMSEQQRLASSEERMRRARRILAEKRKITPSVSIATINTDRLNVILAKLKLPQKADFVRQLLSYWKLKRQQRNGVPLLRRLQSNVMSSRKRDFSLLTGEKQQVLTVQLKYWKQLRHDLERARLLIELIRKREKLKSDLVDLRQSVAEYQLTPLAVMLRNVLEQLQQRDTMGIFAEPVSREEVPEYYNVITQPMDFATMRHKVDSLQYNTFADFEADVKLIVANCLRFNRRETVFYKAALKLREQGAAVLRAARLMVSKVGYDEGGVHASEHTVQPSADTPDGGPAAEASEEQQQLETLLHHLPTAPTPSGKKGRPSIVSQQIGKLRIKLNLARLRHTSPTRRSSRRSRPETNGSEECGEVKTDSAGASEHVSSVSQEAEVMEPSPLNTSSAASNHSEVSEQQEAGGTSGNCKRPADGATDDAVRSVGKRRKMSEVTSGQHSDADAGVVQKRLRTGSERRSVDTAPLSARRCSTRNSQDRVVEGSESAASGMQTADNKMQLRRQSSGDKPATRQQVQQELRSGRRRNTQDLTPGLTEAEEVRGRRRCKSVTSPPVHTLPDTPARHPARIVIKRASASPGKSGYVIEKVVSSREGSVCQLTGTSVPGDSLLPSDSFTRYRSSSVHLISDADLSDAESSESVTSDTSDQTIVGGLALLDTVDDAGSEGVVEPLDLVWAKCRGHPWYPALVIDPRMPRTGYLHNGVPIPVPPVDVLSLHRNYDHPVYLVLFFDTKRTWQWLPRDKVALLGVSDDFDKRKLAEDKKQNIRKAVKVAYERAQAHLRRVTCTESESDDTAPPASHTTPDVTLQRGDSSSDKTSTDHTISTPDDQSVDMWTSVKPAGDMWTPNTGLWAESSVRPSNVWGVGQCAQSSVSTDSEADLADDSASDISVPTATSPRLPADSVQQEAGDSVQQQTGDSVQQEAGDSVQQQTGDSVQQEAGDSVQQQTGDSVQQEAGDSEQQQTGDASDGRVQQETGDSVQQKAGDGEQQETGGSGVQTNDQCT